MEKRAAVMQRLQTVKFTGGFSYADLGTSPQKIQYFHRGMIHIVYIIQLDLSVFSLSFDGRIVL